MKKNILIFIPSTLITNKSGFLEGIYRKYEDFEAYYITDDEIQDQCKSYVGYLGRFLDSDFFPENTLFIESGSQNIKIRNEEVVENSITRIYYDHKAFTSSNVIYTNNESYGVHIKELAQNLDRGKGKTSDLNGKSILNWIVVTSIALINFIQKTSSKLKTLTDNCSTLSHFQNTLVTAKWFLKVVQQERKFSPRIGNAVFSKCIDLILGFFLIWFCLKYEDHILLKFEHISQDFVTHLRKLLIYLMGSPIGLKLNYAFNHSLGRFFFYHINLWRVFLQAMQPILVTYFRVLLIPAVLGISYQIAILSDIISLATFHVYSIYIYAARLFSLQIKGLTSLWRLFIGRKYNPLRNRVDSCEYSSNQLFIGTLGFTILLFLLPTTAMYYTVFATFRLATLLTYILLTKLQDLISNLPLYIMILWIFQSPSIAGTLSIDLKEQSNQQMQIEAKLTALSFRQSIQTFAVGPVNRPDMNPLGKVFHHLVTGKLI